jgi:hypothetical protein
VGKITIPPRYLPHNQRKEYSTFIKKKLKVLRGLWEKKYVVIFLFLSPH